METISVIQRTGEETSISSAAEGRSARGDPAPPPPFSSFTRPERTAGETRRTVTVESEADENASVATGSELPVQEIVSAIQTPQKEADKLELPNIPEGNQFRTWRIAVREAIASVSRDPPRAFNWARKVEEPNVVSDSLVETEGFATLDSKLATALRKVVTGTLGRIINVEKREDCYARQDDDWPSNLADELQPLSCHRGRQ